MVHFNFPRQRGRASLTGPYRKLCLAVLTLLLLGLFNAAWLFDWPAASYAAPQQVALPTNLSKSQAKPGEAIVAFKAPVASKGNQVTPAGATSNEVAQVNSVLDGLHTVSVQHLFSNLPTAKLNEARQKAMQATNRYITDFSQVYLVKFDQAINAGEAVNRLAQTSLVSSAMPNWVLQAPSHEDKSLTTPAAQAQAQRQSRLAEPQAQANGIKLPPNYSYATDGQSYHDAASNNVTGAFAMLQKQYNQMPGQGEFITNISLGNIDDSSTVVENNQRYLEQRGYPKIPVALSSETCDANNVCTIKLDPTATTQDDQGDLTEVMLDFSVMAPPPRGDSRVPNPQAPGQLGEILGAAYGANYSLINPLTNTTNNFFAAFLGAGFLQNPTPDVITASIGNGYPFGFSDNFFEQSQMIFDAVAIMVNGLDIFVTISAGDGQSDTAAAMNPNGITGPTEVTTDPSKIVDFDEPQVWADPKYSYGVTFEPQYLIDSGSNNAGGDTLNDIFNNSPWNRRINFEVSHSQHTTETRWTGQQNFHSGNGSRVNLSAPADDILFLAQVETGGVPSNPVDTFPRLVGGTSASCPEIAAAAAVVRQTARLFGHPLSAVQTRDLLVATARKNVTPIFDLSKANVGPQLDMSQAVNALFKRYGRGNQPFFVRMTVAERKAVPNVGAYGRSFFTDTPQDVTNKTATIDLSQGLVPPSSRTNETVGQSGDNLNSPITFAVDGAFLPLNAEYEWRLSSEGRSVNIPSELYDQRRPYVRLLPSEIFGFLGLPVTSTSDRTVTVKVISEDISTEEKVTFKGQSSATYTSAVPVSFDPLFRPENDNDMVTFEYDLRGLRDGAGGTVDGGELIISDIDRAVPQAFPDLDPNAHGVVIPLTPFSDLTGRAMVRASVFAPHGVGTYGVALRGTKGGKKVAGSTSAWLPLRYAPKRYVVPTTPKVEAVNSGWGSQAFRFYDLVDKGGTTGSSKFNVSYDVSNVPGAKSALIEFSAPTTDFFRGAYVTGDVQNANNFTNPQGDRIDTGNNYGQPGESANTRVSSKSGTASLDAAGLRLTIPAGSCDNTYQVRVFALNERGEIIGVASNPSLVSYLDSTLKACTTP